MATHRMSILGFVLPTNDNASIVPFSNITSTTRNAFVVNFDAAADGEISGVFEVPQNWVAGSTNLIVKWSTANTSGNFDTEFLHRPLADSERVDTNTTPATTTDSGGSYIIAAQGTTYNLDVASAAITDSGWVAGDMVQFTFRRDADDATNDTLGSDAQVWDLLIEYSDA